MFSKFATQMSQTKQRPLLPPLRENDYSRVHIEDVRDVEGFSLRDFVMTAKAVHSNRSGFEEMVKTRYKVDSNPDLGAFYKLFLIITGVSGAGHNTR